MFVSHSAEQVFVRLERAREVLLDEATRVKYDEWRGRGFQSFISFENWLSIQSRVHTVRVHLLLIIVFDFMQDCAEDNNFIAFNQSLK